MSLNVNYLGKVIFKPMLVSSFPYYAGGNMIASSRAPSDLYTQLFACGSSPSYLCYSLVACLPFVCCVFPNPPSFFSGQGKYWFVSIPTEQFSVTVPSAGHL